MMIKPYTKGTVISRDGTKIGYRQLGSGPGLILVHGGMMGSQNFMRLAESLANQFSVYIPDRRGRGLSSSSVGQFGLLPESEDIQALINQTQAEFIFGLSSGAIIVLQAAMNQPRLKKIALYEPPIRVNGTKPMAWVTKYESAMSAGNLGKALIAVVKETSEPSLMTRLPIFLSGPLMNAAIRSDAKKAKGDDIALEHLIPTMRYDAKIAGESDGIIEKSKDIKAEILLLGGEKSQPYLKSALDQLGQTFPKAKRTKFLGIGHLAADNSGKPEVVSKELRNFFAPEN
jgi:pimeloyl-ACP methyl ester carboxylesterase